MLLAHWCEALRCDQAPEPHSQGTRLRGTFGTLPSLSRATLRQRRCTINQVFACFCRRNLPGFYAEPHLRVQMRCSWFPIGHLPSYGESAHSVRPFQAVLPRAESPAVILLIPSKKRETGYFVQNVRCVCKGANYALKFLLQLLRGRALFQQIG